MNDLELRPFGRTAFAFGCGAVTVGTLLHLPMFLMARNTGWRLAGMPMDAGMLSGMALIVLGVAFAAYGLLPRQGARHVATIQVQAADDAPLTLQHWLLLLTLAIGLVIDIMKPASLGFVVPGMKAEYGLQKAQVAWLPLFALTGTFVGSLLWGWFADIYGRRASILLAAIMFVGTTICGAMPSFAWNVAMCFIMGASAGGMLPVVYALLSETMPARHRGWALVLLGALGAAGGYLAASSLSTWLQPLFGWRILWFVGLPTGLILILFSRFIPESPRFLVATGRLAEARRVFERFGAQIEVVASPSAPEAPTPQRSAGSGGLSITVLSFLAIAWSLTNFGLLLWLPSELVARGFKVEVISKLLAQSTVMGLPAVLLAAPLYSRWSTKGTLVLCGGVTAAGLAGLIFFDHLGIVPRWLPLSCLILGSNAMLATMLPYSAEAASVLVRGRATGWIAGCTKFGGVIAQGLGILGLAPGIGLASSILIGALVLPLVALGWVGPETRTGPIDDGLFGARRASKDAA